jgi:hypothetical protein
MLATTLNRIHESGGDPGTAAALAEGLGSSDLWRIAVIHLAGLLRQEPASIGTPESGRIDFRGFSVKLEAADKADADIKYHDCDVKFRADGININNHDGPVRAADMLRLAQFARDHSDTLCFLPPDMRARRFEALASDCGASVEFTRFVCAAFPSLERTVIG